MLISAMAEIYSAFTSLGADERSGLLVADPPATRERGDDGSGLAGADDWYAVKVGTWSAPCCGAKLDYIVNQEPKHEHPILVWPSKDDPVMLKIAARHERDGAQVRPYEVAMGPCVSWYSASPS